MADISPITVARFWSKVSVPPSDTACWEWNGSRHPSGYGKFRVPQYGRAVLTAHRVSYALYNGDFPAEGLVVRHKCDNPSCVNPYHLEQGTPRDNLMDAYERGRMPPQNRRGENNYAAKLTAAKVSEIRERISRGDANTDIANDFGVTHQMISRIRNGKAWNDC